MSSAFISHHHQGSVALAVSAASPFTCRHVFPFAMQSIVACVTPNARDLAHPHVPLCQHHFDSPYVLRSQFGPAVFVTMRTSAFLLHIFHVFRMSAQKQMLRIHAGPDIAFVAHHQARSNLAAKELPRQPMRRIHFSLEPHHAISAADYHSAPQPAPAVRLGTYLRQKFFLLE